MMVNEIVDGRVAVYGDPEEHFPKVARIWSELLGVEVQPHMVPLLFIAYKLVRTVQSPEYSDNSDDIGGYLEIFRRLMGSELVQARTVDEFLAKSSPAPRVEESVSIRDLRLPPVTFRALSREGLAQTMPVTVLTRLTAEELLSIDGIGPIRLQQIIEQLEVHGLRLRAGVRDGS